MMDSSVVRDAVVRQIAVELKVNERDVRGVTSLRSGLKMDSVAAANVLFALEEMYQVEVDLDEIVSVDSVGDIVGLLMAAMSPE